MSHRGLLQHFFPGKWSQGGYQLRMTVKAVSRVIEIVGGHAHLIFRRLSQGESLDFGLPGIHINT
jgi:hypothetical protein